MSPESTAPASRNPVSTAPASSRQSSPRSRRFELVRREMARSGVQVVLCSLGADLPWLTGYEAMPLERLTMLVLPAESDPTLVVPALEAPRVEVEDSLFRLRPWAESEDPVSIVASLVGSATRLAVSDRTWAVFLMALQDALPDGRFCPSSKLTGPLRAVKDEAEIAVLAAAASAADRVADQLMGGEVPLIGRSEADVSADIGRRLVAEGHSRVNFAIVASGPNSASPHHEPGSRLIEAGDPVVCDFGGSLTLDGSPGYCSDTTRTVVAGAIPDGFSEVYDAVRRAQADGVAAATVGARCADVDSAARDVLTGAGLGEQFIHRTGHGIGLEEHEAPYIVSTSVEQLEPGHAFSVEPGAYLPGRYGVRIEDIVVATEAGPRRLNVSCRELTVVDA